jgi:hypothetical protein
VTGTASAGSSSARIRKKVGRYVVVGRIGRGGMGMVYRGLDEALEREVAVKTLTVEGTLDEESRKRFQIEAKAAAKLQHPNIVTVFELGEDRGLPYIAMELLPGVDLETLIRSREPMLIQEKLDVVVQILRGLQFAHDNGIVHRDVKPSNIRLLEDGSVKIMDFGIAKLGGHGVTKTGMMVGTVHYMSPEQIRGRALDGRSDVFSAGVILYELLAGQRPFPGENPTAVLYKIVHEPAPDLADAVVAGATSVVPLVAKALAKDPEGRPSAGRLADELNGLLQGLRASAPSAGDLGDVIHAAQRLIREGKLEDAVHRLQEVTARHPQAVEARRALRQATRELERRSKTGDADADGFPELDATFQAQAGPTRLREAGAGTVIGPADTPAPQPAVPAAPSGTAQRLAELGSRRLLAGAGAGLLLVIAVGIGLIASRDDPPAQPPRVMVRSDPTGAQVVLDGKETGVQTDGELVLADATARQAVLTFRKAGYREETRTVRLPLADGESVRVVLTEIPTDVALTSLPVVTDPPGAAVTLDDTRVAGTTPLTLRLDPKKEHRVLVTLDGHGARELRIPVGAIPPEMKVSLEPEGPVGRVAVIASYPVDVLWKGRTIGRGLTGGQVSLPAGRQTLTLVSPTYFLRANVSVDVPPAGAATLDAPPLGKINIRANPDNCQVLIDGVFVDYPPILDRAIAVGAHTVAFKWPDGGHSEQPVDVGRSSPAYVMGRKN